MWRDKDSWKQYLHGMGNWEYEVWKTSKPDIHPPLHKPNCIRVNCICILNFMLPYSIGVFYTTKNSSVFFFFLVKRWKNHLNVCGSVSLWTGQTIRLLCNSGEQLWWMYNQSRHQLLYCRLRERGSEGVWTRAAVWQIARQRRPAHRHKRPAATSWGTTWSSLMSHTYP